RVVFYVKEGALIEAGNLQHLILSAFDTLSEDAQRCLELAATKGRRFSLRFLKRAFGDEDRVVAVVDELTNIGLIEADPNGGRNTLRFSHALVADSIYQAALLGERKRLHAKVAAAIAQDKDTRPSALAYHYEHAGMSDKAVQFYWQSASEAMAVFAVDIADQQLERAFALIDTQPDAITNEDYGELLVLHCHAMDAFGNFRRLNEVIEKRLPRLAAIGPSPNYVICLTLQALSRCHGAQYDRARQLIDHATKVSAEIDDKPSAAWVQISMMRIYQDAELAPIEAIEDIYNGVRPVALQLGDRHMFLTAIYNLQAAYRSIGQMHKANALIEELETFGRNSNNSRAIAYANWAKAINCFSKRDAKSLRTATQAVLRHAPNGTADWCVASILTVATGLLEPTAGPDPELFTPYMKETREFENFTLHHIAWVGRTLAFFKSGQIARGQRELRAMEVDFHHSATDELKRVLLLYQSDILLTVAGLKPSSGPRPKLALKDIAAFLGMRMFARRKAARLLRSYLQQTPAQAGPLVAQAHFGLGLLAKSRGQHTQANDHLSKAVKFYSDQGYDAAAGDVMTALNG
ncbi:MAG: tetratricopeptide (TPR) repeat protein, partial [Paracoccaceae bacterium]